MFKLSGEFDFFLKLYPTSKYHQIYPTFSNINYFQKIYPAFVGFTQIKPHFAHVRCHFTPINRYFAHVICHFAHVNCHFTLVIRHFACVNRNFAHVNRHFGPVRFICACVRCNAQSKIPKTEMIIT
jgi:hypothetical protein